MGMSKPSIVAAVAAAFAALACASAQAEYRCTAPSLHEDRLACEAAKGEPDALRRFVHRTRMIYGLYFYDYVTQADLERWNTALQADEPRSEVAARLDDRSAARTTND
jgi:hypothetical protein